MNITAKKCATGKWKVEFEIKDNGDNWKSVHPGAQVCAGFDESGFHYHDDYKT